MRAIAQHILINYHYYHLLFLSYCYYRVDVDFCQVSETDESFTRMSYKGAS